MPSVTRIVKFIRKGDKGDPGADGTDGTDGADAKYYIIEASVSVIGVTSTGSYSPSSFIVSEYTINGASKTSSNVNYIHTLLLFKWFSDNLRTRSNLSSPS